MDRQDVKKKILDTVNALANYNMNAWKQVGPGVQWALIEEINKLTSEEQQKDREVIISVCGVVLEPEIDGAIWRADSVTLQTGGVPVIPQTVEIRDKAISILLGLFKSASTDDERRQLINTMRRAGYSGGRVATADEMLNLTLANANRIAEFFLNEAGPLSYEIMAALEHDYLWDYRRARQISKSKLTTCHANALKLMATVNKLREKFNGDATFVKFKVLVGFESVFPQQWPDEDEDKADDFQALAKYRSEEAAKYAASINDENAEEWLALIKQVASIKSNDLATFPPFAEFLTHLGRLNPKLATPLLADSLEELERFSAALLAGLQQSGDDKTYSAEIERALAIPSRLGPLVRHLRFRKVVDTHLAQRALDRALELKDASAVVECLYMAMEAPSAVPPKPDFFEPALKYLNEVKQFGWVRFAWALPDAKTFFASLSLAEASLFIPALMHVPKIEYQAEQLMIHLARSYPQLVWDVFAVRLKHNDDDEPKTPFEKRYEAIPYQFHGLEKELSNDAKAAVAFGRQLFAADPKLFRFRGGRLLAIAFPHCPPQLADELAALAAVANESDGKFILAVLENYHGEETTHETLKRLLVRFPGDERVRTGVMISLEGTGVVMGEFGFADALRGKLELVRKWAEDPRAEVRSFADDEMRSLEVRIADEQRHAEGRKALRELEYESDEEPEAARDAVKDD
jgi:hypothetical protein